PGRTHDPGEPTTRENPRPGRTHDPQTWPTTTNGECSMTQRGGVRGRVALVTGGTSGIGAAISRRLAGQGAHIAAGYWGFDERAQEFLAAMKADFPDQQVTLHEGNISAAQDCRRVVREVVAQHGRLDILINNAGITIDRTVARMTDEQWQKV